MLELRGAPALSPYRSEKLFGQLTNAVEGVQAIYAEFMHFVDTEAELGDADQVVLDRLLTYGPSADRQEPARVRDGRPQAARESGGTVAPGRGRTCEDALAP